MLFNNLPNLGIIYRFYSTKRLTNLEKNSYSVPKNLHDIIIGLLLGDLSAQRTSITSNTRFQFHQGVVHEAYILYLFELFKDNCGSSPKSNNHKPNKQTDKIYSSIRFFTYSLPCFNYYHELFYVNGIKIIPKNIGELLTPEGLAYWSMDDGTKGKSGFYLSTDCYSLSEIELLIKVLKENLNLNCTYHKKEKDSYRIYIKSESMDTFRSFVTAHFHESMKYKLA